MAIFVPRFVRQLRDVLIASPADGEVLTYDSADEKWKNEAGGGGGGPPTGAAGGVLGGTYPNPGFAVDMATQAELDAHVTDITDAHDATAVSVAPFGTIAATQVQAALEEIVAEAVTDLGPAVILAPASSARNVIQPTAGDVIAAIVKAHAAQSVDLTQWQTSGGAVLASMSRLGMLLLTPSSVPDATTGIVRVFDFPFFDVPATAHDVATVFAAGATTNADQGIYGQNDAAIRIVQQSGGGATAERMATALLTWRRVTDGKNVATAYLAPSGFIFDFTDEALSGSYTTSDPTPISNLWVAPTLGWWHGGLVDQGGISLFQDYDGNTPRLLAIEDTGVFKWGIFGSAAVAQQAASTIADLWTGLKDYGWLTSGSTAPDMATQAELDAHLNDAADAHDASAISILDAANDFTATDVEGALAELQADHEADVTALAVVAKSLREQARITGEGLLFENFSRQHSSGSIAAVDGTVYFVAQGLLAGDVVTNLHPTVAVVGAGITVAKMGLYSAAGVLLRATADLGTSWHSLGTPTHALTSAFTVLTDGLYYTAILVKWSTTAPTFIRLGNASSPTAIGAGALPYGRQTGQTDLPANATIALASGVSCIWMGGS